MQATSHIVEVKARANIHSLSKAPSHRFPHTAEMDKNGGPNHLKAWREFRKLSQESLGAAVNTTGTVISMLESGERGLSAKWLRRLSGPLRATPGHILEHDPATLPTDIVEIWLNATEDERRQLIGVAKAIVRTGTDG